MAACTLKTICILKLLAAFTPSAHTADLVPFLLRAVHLKEFLILISLHFLFQSPLLQAIYDRRCQQARSENCEEPNTARTLRLILSGSFLKDQETISAMHHTAVLPENTSF